MNLNFFLPILSFLITLFLILILKNNFFFKKYLLVLDEFVTYSNKKNYKLKTITGMGVIFIAPFFVSSGIIFFSSEIELPNRYFFFLISLLLLTLISFKDDIKSLDPKLRLIIHLILIYISIASLQINLIPLPLKVSILLVLLIWVYLMNITNFIDGSDGVCSINVIFFYIGIIVLSLNGYSFFSYYIALIIIPTLLAFMIFNYPNASIFMGDSGAIFLGFLVGFSFLELAILTNPFYSIILFLYPLLDCSITITKRVLRGYQLWDRLGDYYFLLPKRRVKAEKRKKISLFIFRGIFIFNILNLLIFAFFLETNYYFLFTLNIIFGLILLMIFRLRRFTKKYMK